MDTRAKNRRINLRTSAHQEDILRAAAHEADTTVSDFILRSAVTNAQRLLADRRTFSASPEQFEEFMDILDTPMDATKLHVLLERPSAFGQSFVMDDGE